MSGVVVLGMHRSGTSALTRVLNLLGLATCVESDLLGPDDFNTKGHWESSTVTSCNELLLWSADSAWWVPPSDQGWLQPWSDSLVESGQAAFRAVHHTEPWVLKDPRLCLTFPFWARALAIDGVVIALRHPASIAQSLHRRGGMDLDYAVALWERHARWSLSFAAGLPALVTSYDELLDATDAWVTTATTFLTQLHVPVPSNPLPDITSFLGNQMRHFRSEVNSILSPEAASLWELCKDLSGPHHSLPDLALADETPAVGAMFEAVRNQIRDPDFGERPSGAFERFRAAVATRVGS